MKKMQSLFQLLAALIVLINVLSANSAQAAPLSANYPTDPTANIVWSAGTSGVTDIQSAFNNARTVENSQLGTSLPMMTLPNQSSWTAMSDGEKALWLINRERIDRGLVPLEGVETNVTTVAQNYASYLLNNNKWGHTEDGLDPWLRLEANPQINACHDFLNVAENLAVFVTSGSSIPLPIERSVYDWMYDDQGSAWGHRHAILWYPYNNNKGSAANEGFLGIGRASGAGYQGPFSQPWNFTELVVMNVFDPCATYVNTATTTLVNSVLPTSRTVPVGTMATIFNTVINAGTSTATGVTLSMNPAPAGTFVYQETNCATNAIVGAPNPSLDIAPGAVRCYVLSFTPSATFAATSVHIRAQASNAPSTSLLTGINTWLLRSASSAGPDIIALTTTTDFHQVACTGTNAFAVALSNVGAAATGNITVTANTGAATLPLSVLISETNPGTGAIIGNNVLQNVGAGENRTVAVFVTFNGCINFDAAVNRIFIEFRDAGNNVVGSTSTAVSTGR